MPRSKLQDLAHEMRQPLTVVLANAELLLKTATDPQVRDVLEEIRAAAHRLEGQTDQLAAIARGVIS